jgi:hypothetical protein
MMSLDPNILQICSKKNEEEVNHYEERKYTTSFCSQVIKWTFKYAQNTKYMSLYKRLSFLSLSLFGVHKQTKENICIMEIMGYTDVS